MTDTDRPPIEPKRRQARGEAGVDWQRLLVGALTGVSVLGAAFAQFQSGSASRSAESASHSEYVTRESAEKFKALLLAIQAQQQRNIGHMEALEKRIGVLEAASRPPH